MAADASTVAGFHNWIKALQVAALSAVLSKLYYSADLDDGHHAVFTISSWVTETSSHATQPFVFTCHILLPSSSNHLFPNKLKPCCRLFGEAFMSGFDSHSRSHGHIIAFLRLHHAARTFGCERRDEESLWFSATVSFQHSIFLLQSHPVVLHSWWGASLCPSEGEGGRFTLRATSSSCPSLMITMSQQVLHLPHSPLLCIPPLIPFVPSWLQPLWTSQERNSPCSGLTLIWCNRNCNDAHFCLHVSGSEFNWGRGMGTAATSSRLLLFNLNHFYSALLASFTNPRQQKFFSLGHFILINWNFCVVGER